MGIINADQLTDYIFALCKEQGIESPTLADCSDDTVAIVDTESGETYRITLVKF